MSPALGISFLESCEGESSVAAALVHQFDAHVEPFNRERSSVVAPRRAPLASAYQHFFGVEPGMLECYHHYLDFWTERKLSRVFTQRAGSITPLRLEVLCRCSTHTHARADAGCPAAGLFPRVRIVTFCVEQRRPPHHLKVTSQR